MTVAVITMKCSNGSISVAIAHTAAAAFKAMAASYNNGSI